MTRIATTASLIRQHIEELPVGEPFTPATLLRFGSRASVDQTLSRLVRAGVIERVTRGVFVRPEISRFAGKVMPEPFKIAQTIARSSGASLQVHGAEAARRLGLTTQVPTQPVFLTSGPPRRLRMGSMEVRLQHVSPRKLALAGRPAGLALAAMWYLGAEEVTPALIGEIRSALGGTEFEALQGAKGAMPGWMSDVMHRYEQSALHPRA